MIKKTLITISLLLLLAVGGGFYYFDSLVKNGIEIAGSQVLGTEVTVASVSISPLNGTGSINGLKIQNPEGFNSDYAIELGALAIDLDLSTVFSEVILVNSVVVTNPQVTYENRITTDNIRALLSNLSDTGSTSSTTAAETQESGPGTEVIVKDFQMLDPQVTLVAAAISAPIRLPDVHLQNIGQAGDSVSIAEAS
jgi:hypothetical protein